jgi:hypothetical protein
LDGSINGYFKITGISGGTLFQSDGLTPISNGQYITFAQGEAGLKYTPAANSIANDTVTVEASLSNSDAGLGGSTATAVISVLPVPITSASGPQTTIEDTSLVFSSAAGNSITASDPGNSAGIVQIDLSVTSGTLTLGHRAGITFTSGTGTANSAMTFSGTFTAVNRALSGLRFTPALHSFETVDMTVTSTEGSNSATSNVTINVLPIAHTPTVTSTSTSQNQQTENVVVITPSAADSSLAGYFQITSIINGSLFENDGVTPINNGDFITFSQGQAGLIFTPNVNSPSVGEFSVQASTLPATTGRGGAIAKATIIVGSIAPVGPPNSIPTPAPAPAPSPGPVVLPSGDSSDASDISDALQTSKDQQAAQNSQSQKDQQGKAATSTLTSNFAPPKVGGAVAAQGGTATVRSADDLFSHAQALTGVAVSSTTTTPERSEPAFAVVLFATQITHQLRLPDITTRIGTIEIAQGLAFLNRGSAMWHELDSLKKRMVSDAPVRIWAGTASVVSAGVSVVYLLWIARAGSLLSSLLSSMPAWRLVDPLPILDHLGNTAAMLKRSEDDGLERLINDASGR